MYFLIQCREFYYKLNFRIDLHVRVNLNPQLGNLGKKIIGNFF